MFIKAKIALLLTFLFGAGLCVKKTQPVYQKMTCDVDYALHEVYYDASTKLTMNVVYHWFSDSIGQIDHEIIDSSLQLLNDAFFNTGITFEILSVQEIVSEEGRDMPSYVRHARKYNDRNAINIYVYNDDQPHFSEDKKGVVGSAGGIPSTFFAIRKSFLNTITIAHEAGHAVGGLYHVDTPDSDSTGSTSRTGDKICDTPRSFNLIENVTTNCIYNGSENYTPEQLSVITCNIMSDAYAKCRSCFTEGQIQRMKWVVEQSQDLRNTIKEPLINF